MHYALWRYGSLALWVSGSLGLWVSGSLGLGSTPETRSFCGFLPQPLSFKEEPQMNAIEILKVHVVIAAPRKH